MIFRVGWSSPASAVGATPAQAQAASNATRDTWMLVLTAVSAYFSAGPATSPDPPDEMLAAVRQICAPP